MMDADGGQPCPLRSHGPVLQRQVFRNQNHATNGELGSSLRCRLNLPRPKDCHPGVAKATRHERSPICGLHAATSKIMPGEPDQKCALAYGFIVTSNTYSWSTSVRMTTFEPVWKKSWKGSRLRKTVAFLGICVTQCSSFPEAGSPLQHGESQHGGDIFGRADIDVRIIDMGDRGASRIGRRGVRKSCRNESPSVASAAAMLPVVAMRMPGPFGRSSTLGSRRHPNQLPVRSWPPTNAGPSGQLGFSGPRSGPPAEARKRYSGRRAPPQQPTSRLP